MREIRYLISHFIILKIIHIIQRYYTDLPIIPTRYNRPDYLTVNPPRIDAPRLHKCGLCESSFNSEDELSYHIKTESH
jgi:hypothetical protein